MSLSLAEQELVIRVALDETEVTYTGSGSVWVGRLKRLAQQTSCLGEMLSPDVYRVCIPVTQVRLLSVKKKSRPRTDAEKEAFRVRMANLSASRSSTARTIEIKTADETQG